MAKKFPEPRRWIPQHPEKYDGNHLGIITRSSWEVRFANWCDMNSNVVKWSSEETIVPYRCGTDNKIHRYFLDFRIQVRNKDGGLKTFLVEIKPSSQCIPPVKGKNTKRYINESLTYVKNMSKWEAADRFAKDRGWEFIVLNESHLGIK